MICSDHGRSLQQQRWWRRWNIEPATGPGGSAERERGMEEAGQPAESLRTGEQAVRPTVDA